MRSLRHVLGAAAAVLLVGAVIGLVTRDDGSDAGPAVAGEVQIADFAFAPEPATVAVGSTLTWTNTDSTDHTVDSPDGTLHSGSIGEGATYEVTFEEPGTFTYICAFHPFMKGTVEVSG